MILEGLGLGVPLVLICAAGIRKGAVGMMHLYSPAVQQRCVKLGLTSPERIRRNSLLFKAVCVPGYISYVLVCVYGINGARSFAAGFWQVLVILSVMNLIDRFLIDGYWVGHTNAWTIPGTEKNTVQETLILPLYSRKLCTELYPNLYRDETAVHLIDQIDYDFSEAEKNPRSLMQRFGALEVAMRQNDLAFEVRAYLKTHPCAAVVNLGCGLDNTGRACDNGRCKIYNPDFPDVIALQQQLLPAGERYLDLMETFLQRNGI